MKHLSRARVHSACGPVSGATAAGYGVSGTTGRSRTRAELALARDDVCTPKPDFDAVEWIRGSFDSTSGEPAVQRI